MQAIWEVLKASVHLEIFGEVARRSRAKEDVVDLHD